MKTINTTQQFKEFVGDNGRLFSVTFRKADGSIRKIGCETKCEVLLNWRRRKI